MRSWHLQLADKGDAAIPSSSSLLQAQDLTLPDKPSIVVLPFDNMSAEPGQDYLADGIVEAITAALSSIRSFFVIARSSAFATRVARQMRAKSAKNWALPICSRVACRK